MWLSDSEIIIICRLYLADDDNLTITKSHGKVCRCWFAAICHLSSLQYWPSCTGFIVTCKARPLPSLVSVRYLELKIRPVVIITFWSYNPYLHLLRQKLIFIGGKILLTKGYFNVFTPTRCAVVPQGSCAWISGSMLFRSIMAQGQNYFWKYIFSFLRKGAC